MKLLILSLLALPLIFVGCKKEETDSDLNGLWSGEESSIENNRPTTNSVVYKFNDANIETHNVTKSASSTRSQVEVGTYTKEDNILTFRVAKHSCVEAKLDIPLKKEIMYKISDDGKSLVIRTGLNTISLVKVAEEAEEKYVQKVLKNSQKGCFTTNDNGVPVFKPGKVEKPTRTDAELEQESTELLEATVKEAFETTEQETL